jgi:hypothetical protein
MALLEQALLQKRTERMRSVVEQARALKLSPSAG